ncbi:DNA/RNA polymerase [Testicularia cyperi]|uniref:DNA polymerase kappa n=1 Tax=Testicularia cyperi TaxID=1882483 RepID=A0A317XW85_9BASI|nr:DNA/RNA polymerase [Testicularia cyperi]
MNFFRDRDANGDAFDDPRNDPTAAAVSSTSTSPSTSPRKRQKIELTASSSRAGSDQDAALESLRKRMAGPSSAKAGLAKDQDEINRIIYEVSKGSKFFENERKKDAQTTERIHALLARRDEKLRQTPPGSADWLVIERRIEDMATKLENARDLTRTILHTDIDMFYAAVELARDPSLKGKCFGVGSGVLVTASYEARRGYGVRSGMATFVAKALCPHLIVVKNDMASYVEASHKVMAVLEQYDENLAKASLDEAYLDITDYVEQDGRTIEEVVAQLRAQVKEQTHLTVSVGIAPNTMLAKISSDRNKPDGQYRVMPDRKTIVDFMRDLPCRKIPGIGRVNERILESLGVTTCGEIWNKRVELWLALDGKIDWLLKAHLGLGNTVVEPGKREERKSVGREHTFSPTSDTQMLFDLLRESATRVQQDLERLDFRAKTITLVAKRDTFQRFSRAKTSTRPLYKAEDLFEITSNLLKQEIEREGQLCLRLIGVRTTHLVDLRSAAAGEERLRKMFQTPSHPADVNSGGLRPQRRKTAQELHEEEERQLALAIRESLEGAQNPFDPVQDLSQDDPPNVDAAASPLFSSMSRVGSENGAKGADSAPPLPPITKQNVAKDPDTGRNGEDSSDAQCPICDQTIRGTNEQLNQHIDACLNGSLIKHPSSSSSSSSSALSVTSASAIKSAKTGASSSTSRKKGPLDGFVRRSKS